MILTSDEQALRFHAAARRPLEFVILAPYSITEKEPG
jgi:hypothetical protein